MVLSKAWMELTTFPFLSSRLGPDHRANQVRACQNGAIALAE